MLLVIGKKKKFGVLSRTLMQVCSKTNPQFKTLLAISSENKTHNEYLIVYNNVSYCLEAGKVVQFVKKLILYS